MDNLLVEGLIASHTANVLGEALEVIGKKDAATQIYSDGIINLEKMRYFNTYSTSKNKQKWFAQTVPYYKKAASFFIGQNDPSKAFRAAELCKGRTLAEQYNDLLATYKGGLSNEDIYKLNEYKEKNAQFKDTFSEEFKYSGETLKFNFRWAQIKIMNEYNLYTSQLRKKYPKYEEALSVGINMGLISSLIESELFFKKQIKDMILPGYCYISFSVAKKDEESNTSSNEILTFVTNDKGEVKSFALKVDDDFFEECELYHDLNSYSNIEEMNVHDKKYLWLANGKYVIGEGRDNAPEVGAVQIKAKEDKDGSKWREIRQKVCVELSAKLMPTLEKFAGNSTHWIISPDGELNLVPFETLIYRDKMLIESVDVSYVPSLAVMNLMKETGEKNSKLVNRKELFAMGDAIYNADVETAHDSQQNFFKLF